MRSRKATCITIADVCSIDMMYSMTVFYNTTVWTIKSYNILSKTKG